ncbi:MAG: hypothetical protein Q8O00_13075 [Holophaga sp.]|nr:hypothetical protein [Holophaga sp.]
MKSHHSAVILLALAAIHHSTLRAQESRLEPLPAPTDIVWKLGGEADSEQGRLAEIKFHWRPSHHSLLSAGYTYSTLSSTNITGTSAHIASIAGEYAFGAFGLGGGYTHVAESDLLKSNAFSLKPFYESGAWRLELSGSHRSTQFDRFSFTNIPIQGPLATVYVSGSAQLDLTSKGIGGSIDYLGETWHAYVSYDTYSYGEFAGETSVTAIREANGSVSTRTFTALASRMATRLQRFAGSAATRKAGLLDNSALVGLDINLRPVLLGFELGRDQDHLTQATATSYTGIVSLDTSRRTTLELRGGAIQSDTLGTIRFIGLSLTVRSIPKGIFN